MRKLFIFALPLLAVVLMTFSNGYAVEQTATPAPSAPKALKSQTLCPVMGNKIDTTVFTDIQGQRVYFCCPGCISKLKANPDKYFQKAAEEGVLFKNIQTACPVSGEEIDKAIYTDYQGRRIYFCCKKCVAEFQKSPANFLTKMDKPAPKDAPETKDSTSGHMMHEGMGH